MEPPHFLPGSPRSGALLIRFWWEPEAREPLRATFYSLTTPDTNPQIWRSVAGDDQITASFDQWLAGFRANAAAGDDQVTGS